MINLNICRNRHLLKHRLFEVIGTGLTLLCLATPTYASNRSASVSQYVGEYWGSERGFPDRSVTAIAQTKDGYLWIGTDKGLIRFDGLNFRLFEQASPGAFSIGGIQALQTDNEGNLWILSQNTRILRYRNGDFEPGREPVEFGVTAISTRRDGAVLLSSLSSGMLLYRGKDFQPLPFATQVYSSSNRSRFYTKPNSALALTELPDQAVTSIAEAADGDVWLGTQANGLFKLTGRQLSAAGRGLTTSKITCLLPLDNGSLWIGTDKGIKTWTGSSLTVLRLTPALRNASILALVRDHNSNIWIGTDRGLFVVDGNSISSEQVRRVSPGSVTALFEDREGNLWVGGSRGIQRLRYKPFFTYTANGQKPEAGGPVFVDRNRGVWFAPAGGGLHWLRDGKDETITNDNLKNDVVYSITGLDQEVWVGRQRGGLTMLHYNAGSVIAKTYRQSDGLAQNGIYTVYRGDDGTVWAGTLTGGVSQIRRGRFKTYTTANGLSSNTVTSITEGPDQAIWFATPNGLSGFSNGHWRRFTISDGLPSADINCLLSDSKKILWIGSANGLSYIADTSNQVRIPIHLPEALREQILGIAEDRNNWLWISTSSHLLRIRRDALLEGQFNEADMHEYGPADGLLGTEGVKRDRSVFADPVGRIWLATTHGLSVVDPSKLAETYAPVLVHIDDLSADGRPIATEGPIHIPSSRQRITFSFVGLSLTDPDRVRYRYRLDGFDRDWSDPVAARSAVYTNLRQGSYHFRVMACNSEGAWSENEAALAFDITPVWFQTNWFRSLSVIAFICCVWVLYQLRVRWISKAISARFDERLAERTRLARDLHDTLLQTIQGSKMVADTALDEPTDLPRMRQYMEQLAGWLGQATHEGRTALQSLRSSTVQTNDLAEAFQQALDGCHLRGFPDASLIVEGTAMDMHPIVRDEIYRIGYEAIRNACQHSGADHLKVHLSYGQELTLRVSDDGRGMDETLVARGKMGHFGLQGMRERAQRIGGKFTLDSVAWRGTQMQLVVPGHIIFRKNGMTLKNLSSKIRDVFRKSKRF